MKTTGVYKVWQMIYPVGIYYVVSGLVYFGLELMLGPAGTDYMLRQLICAAVTIPFIGSFYREDRRKLAAGSEKRGLQMQKTAAARSGQSGLRSSDGGRGTGDAGAFAKGGFWIRLCLSAIAGGAAGIALNNLIVMARLTQVSAGFQEANEAFFAGKIVYELLGSCLVIPLAEELLYRGVVYRRMRAVFGIAPAIVLSAALFGLMHANLVQFLYAGLLGLLLAFLTERTGSLWTAVAAHIAANLLAVIRQESGWLDFCYEVSPAAVICTAAFAALAAAAVAGVLWEEKRRGKH